MTKDIYFSIANDFSKYPGPRFSKEGEFSAEELLDKHLINLFKNACDSNSKLIVDIDGTFGYATSFLEGAFGELVRRFNKEKVQNHILIQSKETPLFKEEIEKFINEA